MEEHPVVGDLVRFLGESQADAGRIECTPRAVVVVVVVLSLVVLLVVVLVVVVVIMVEILEIV